MIKQDTKQNAFISIIHENTHTLLLWLYSSCRQDLLLVRGKDVELELLKDGFERSFIGGGSDKKTSDSRKKKRKDTECLKTVVKMYNRQVQIGFERPRPDLSS